MQDNTRDNRVLRGAMREAGFGAMDAIFAVLLLAAGVASLVALNQDKQEAAAEQVVVDRLGLEGQAANAFYRRNAQAVNALAAQAKISGRSYDAQAQASNPSLRFTTANFVQAGLLPATLQKDTAGRYSDSDGHVYATQVALHYAPNANGQPTTTVDGVWLLTYPEGIDPNRPLGFSDKEVGQYVAADPEHAGTIKAGRFVGVGGRIIKNLQQDFQLTLAGMVRPALIQPVAYLNNAGGGAGGGGGSSSGPLVAVRTPGTTVTVGGNGTTTVTTPIGSTTAGGGGVSTTTPTSTTTVPATPATPVAASCTNSVTSPYIYRGDLPNLSGICADMKTGDFYVNGSKLDFVETKLVYLYSSSTAMLAKSGDTYISRQYAGPAQYKEGSNTVVVTPYANTYAFAVGWEQYQKNPAYTTYAAEFYQPYAPPKCSGYGCWGLGPELAPKKEAPWVFVSKTGWNVGNQTTTPYPIYW